jgi:hypothetical protein
MMPTPISSKSAGWARYSNEGSSETGSFAAATAYGEILNARKAFGRTASAQDAIPSHKGRIGDI